MCEVCKAPGSMETITKATDTYWLVSLVLSLGPYLFRSRSCCCSLLWWIIVCSISRLLLPRFRHFSLEHIIYIYCLLTMSVAFYSLTFLLFFVYIHSTFSLSNILAQNVLIVLNVFSLHLFISISLSSSSSSPFLYRFCILDFVVDFTGAALVL